MPKSGAKCSLLAACSLHIVLFFGIAKSQAPDSKAVVFGTPTANLRAGAGIEHPISTTLKEGDSVAIEQLEGDWYRVTTADGQRGYIHKNLLKLAGEAGAASAPPGSATPAAPAPVGSKIDQAPAAKKATSSTPAKSPSSTTPSASASSKSPSILQMMEGHENAVVIAAAVAAGCFIVGWILGGHFALRRDRVRRRRIQF